jgi:hypothetical protein
MAGMLDDIGRWVSTSTTYWNAYQRDIRERLVPNAIEAPRAQEGGGLSIRYGFGWWELEPGQALVVTFAPPPARYWSLQPYSVGWFEVLDYRNRQTTINNAQAAVDDDGLVRVIVSASDPGTPNWIDTTGHPQGQLIMRWIWADEAAASVAPDCAVVPIESVRVSRPVDRAAIVRARRISVARRHRR